MQVRTFFLSALTAESSRHQQSRRWDSLHADCGCFIFALLTDVIATTGEVQHCTASSSACVDTETLTSNAFPHIRKERCRERLAQQQPFLFEWVLSESCRLGSSNRVEYGYQSKEKITSKPGWPHHSMSSALLTLERS